MKDLAVKTENLAAGYGRKIVLSGVEIELNPGEITSLIGRNGCGKSTLLNTISRLLKPISGSVSVFGSDFSKIRPSKRAELISVLTTDRPRPERMTCLEVVEEGRISSSGAFGRLSAEDRRAVDDALSLTETEALSAVQFSKCSDGQRQRLLLARAVAQDSPVLLLDEPTAFLDPAHKISMVALLKKLARERGKCVVASLHELDVARAISDRVICVSNGRAVEYASAQEVFSNGTVARLFSIPEALFDGKTGTINLFGN